MNPSIKQSFIVNINGKKITCTKKLCSMSTFLNNILFLGINTFDMGFQDEQQDQQQQIHLQLIDQKNFNHFLQFCQINNYKQPLFILPVRSNSLEDVIDQKNYQFIKKFDFLSSQFNQLLKAAQFLGCKDLQKLLAVKVFCLIYFADSKEEYIKKTKQLEIPSKIDLEDYQKYKQMYPFLNL